MATQILMPALSPTMEEGTLAKWLVKEGDTVKSGDIMAEIETDKATMEFEAVDEGIIGKILVAEGTVGCQSEHADCAYSGRWRRCGCGPRRSRTCGPCAKGCRGQHSCRRGTNQLQRLPHRKPRVHGCLHRLLARRIAAEKGHRPDSYCRVWSAWPDC